ncbi:uncharacterized protein LOC117580179 isoform X2 [Drosophila guanche]|uniref:uncharacterized protein LOC117580179 isoform X2 n=1 Tax=Drosophila guanche TaxID=7266 RepID=UPI001471EA0D|nr:uncharacterized protein LOC117580179 isoform X2 [Drosophila guanche]
MSKKSNKSNKIVKNKASRGRVEDIEMAKQVATQSTEELENRNESEANFFRDYVAKQNGCMQEKKNLAEGEKQYCCSFHAELLQKRRKPPASYPLISNPIWNRALGPIPPTISTPGFSFNIKNRDNKKTGGVVEVPEIFDTFAFGAELERRGYKSKIQLPDFRKIKPGLFQRAMMDEDRPILDAKKVQAKPSTSQHSAQPELPPDVKQANALQNKMPGQENKKTGKKTQNKSTKKSSNN